jgi:hypothetical protein
MRQRLFLRVHHGGLKPQDAINFPLAKSVCNRLGMDCIDSPFVADWRDISIVVGVRIYYMSKTVLESWLSVWSGAPEAGGRGGGHPPLPSGWGVQGGEKCPFGTRGAEVPFGRKGLESVASLFSPVLDSVSVPLLAPALAPVVPYTLASAPAPAITLAPVIPYNLSLAPVSCHSLCPCPYPCP